MGTKEDGNILILGGCGPMGLGAVSYGIQFDNKPKRIVVTDISDERIARAKQMISPEQAAEKGVELTLHDVLSEKAANAISHSSVRLTSVMENTISTTLEDTIIVEETLNELSKIMDFLSEEEREIIKAKAEACSKKDFLVKMRNLGYKKGSERDIYNKVSAKAQKYAYQNGLVKCITA